MYKVSKMKYLKLFFGLVSALLRSCHVNSNTCYDLTGGGNLAQIAFLFDRALPHYHNPILEGLTQSINSEHAVVYPGIVSFDKFDGGSTSKQSCFKVEEAFSRNSTSYVDVVNKIQASQSSQGSRSPITAAAFASASHKLGWLHGDRNSRGQRIRRLIVFIAEHDDGIVNNLSGRQSKKSFVGDGNDTCLRRPPLDYATVRQMFRTKGSSVLALLSSQDLKEKYDLHFYSLGIPYCSAVYNGADAIPTTLATKIDECLKAINECSEG